MLEAQNLLLEPTRSVALANSRSIVSIAAFKNRLGELQSTIGVVLPLNPTRITQGGTDYLWSGPQSWLAISGDAELSSHFAGLGSVAAITDQSDGRVVFRVKHPHARENLAKLLPIDLHESAFSPNATALTLAGHISVQIWQADDGAFEISCFRSFAAALHYDLVTAIDFGAENVG